FGSNLLRAYGLPLNGFEGAPCDVQGLIEHEQDGLRAVATSTNPPTRGFSGAAVEQIIDGMLRMLRGIMHLCTRAQVDLVRDRGMEGIRYRRSIQYKLAHR